MAHPFDIQRTNCYSIESEANAMARISNVTDAIQQLNWNYGRGDVRKVRVFADGRIEFTRQPFGMKTETRRGRKVGNTVYALGHQRTIGQTI